MSGFDVFIGVDYSGAQGAASRLPGLQVFATRPGILGAERWSSPTPSNNGQRINWSRREIAERLRDEARRGTRFLAGIDHAFSFPVSYFRRYRLETWAAFLADFCVHWPTRGDHVYVDFVRDGSLFRDGEAPPPGQRTGANDEFRMTERWTSSAKSVFRLDGQGTVGKSTLAGIPWLEWLRTEVGDRVHFWPFDGWTPTPGPSVITEVYPSLWSRSLPKADRTPDQHDAWSVAEWLRRADADGEIAEFLNPDLSREDRATAAVEGWILGLG